MTSPTIFIIAGEPSGDALGAKFLAAWKAKMPDSNIHGIGGSRMQAQGLESLFPMQELSIMGFWEVLPHIPKLLDRLKQTVRAIEELQPDIVLTIDSPGFNFRLAKMLNEVGIRKAGSKLVHYVAPTVWAYKPGRAKKMAPFFDHLLVLLPFEPPYFQKVGLPTTFVGHPVVEDAVKPDAASHFRQAHDIPEDAKVITVLLGSRMGEIERLTPIFVEALLQLKLRIPNLHTVFPVAPEVEVRVRQMLHDFPIGHTVTARAEEKHEAFAVADVALVKSGTVALEVAMAATPMIVAYRVHPISAFLLRFMLKTPYVNLINLIESQSVVPEMLQEQCESAQLSDALYSLLQNPEAQAKQKAAFVTALGKLGLGQGESPSERCVDCVLDVKSLLS